MESNKILIGVQFQDRQNSYVIELIVLRDSTLSQLIDGVKYGIAKKAEDMTQKEKEVYNTCREILNDCLSATEESGANRNITITSYDNTANENVDQHGRIRFNLIEDGAKKLCDLGFISSTRIIFERNADLDSRGLNTIDVTPAFYHGTMPKPEKVFPEYNISTRQMYQFDTSPMQIIPPSEPPQKPKQNILLMLLPTILMVGVMVLVRGVIASGGAGGSSMVLMSLAMGLVTALTTVFSVIRQRKEYKRDVATWKNHYREYIKSVISDITHRQAADVQKLDALYPELSSLISATTTVSGDIFSRSQADADFLTVRLGNSDQVESMFEIEGERKDVVFSSARFTLEGDSLSITLSEEEGEKEHRNADAYLSNLPNQIAQTYHCLKNAPLLLPLKNGGVFGIVSEQKQPAMTLIQNMIFELCYYHCPADVQFVAFLEQEEDWNKIDYAIRDYKFLPHFRGLFEDKSQFVFDPQSAGSVLSSLLKIMSERRARLEQSDAKKTAEHRTPQIVFLVFEEHGLKEHAFAEFLPRAPEDAGHYVDQLGITFIFVKRFKEHLPEYCGQMIFMNHDGIHSIVPRENGDKKQYFVLNGLQERRKSFYNAYKIFSALYYSQISQNGKVPSNVSFFEMLEGFGGAQFKLDGNRVNVEDYWKEENNQRIFDVTKSLGVPLGLTDNGLTMLDLHEKSDGPHMLVAGTTGSGKSETIISYLLGLCLLFRPDELNMMLVDMKGGGFIKRIGDLPHVVGKVTDVDGDENGTGAEYMLKRFLNALAAEIKRRKILFNQMHVDSIDGYITACWDIDLHIKSLHAMDAEEEALLRAMAKQQRLSHLILVVDEFTELKRFTSENNDVDFIGEITTIARVGRSLGFHIILISQNIEGAITEDIRVNAKSRLCLKVATRQASKEMINNDLAAAPTMPGNGRAYLLVGTGSKFEYFQSAYSGANALDSVEAPVEIIQAEKKGSYTVFYNSDQDNLEIKAAKKAARENGTLKTQLQVLVESVKQHYHENKERYPAPHIVFQPPLPNRVTFKNGESIILST